MCLPSGKQRQAGFPNWKPHFTTALRRSQQKLSVATLSASQGDLLKICEYIVYFMLFLYAGIYMETALKDAQIPEIWETEEDKKLSDGNLKHKYFIFARSRFVRNPQEYTWN